jgi:NhaA family Na+:H+ antiporter
MNERDQKSITSIAVRPFLDFFKAETSAGRLLLITTAVAFLWANSKWADFYFHIWEIPLPILVLTKTLHHWINDGLMAIFFFLVGLEIKREMTVGELASLRKAALPVLAAIGGMLFPALIYLFCNLSEPASRGWGIPMATDIAFSLGILGLLGPRIPLALKIFLSAFAIVDDIGAVLVIALFYTAEISWIALGCAFAVVVILFSLNRGKSESIWLYIIFGLILWVCVLKSGVHATVAGVLLAMFIPADKVHKLEHALHPWVAFAIIPIFALANAGVSLRNTSLALIAHPIFIGIVMGLVVGKQFGVFLASLLGIKTGMAALPQDVTMKQIYGVGWLGGIGFTMSIFVATLAFEENELLSISKLAILSASIISGIGGWILLKTTTK